MCRVRMSDTLQHKTWIIRWLYRNNRACITHINRWSIQRVVHYRGIRRDLAAQKEVEHEERLSASDCDLSLFAEGVQRLRRAGRRPLCRRVLLQGYQVLSLRPRAALPGPQSQPTVAEPS